MTDLPAPPVPADGDLRSFPDMPLAVLRLRDSDIATGPDAEAFRCAVLTWCVSWHQVPAGSLPDDEATLARLVGFGRDLKGWAKVRASAMRGWTKHNDGRLYHPVVAEKVNAALTHKEAAKKRREAEAKRIAAWRKKNDVTADDTPGVTDSVTRNTCVRSYQIGSDQIEKSESTSPSSSDVSPREEYPDTTATTTPPGHVDEVRQATDRYRAAPGSALRSKVQGIDPERVRLAILDESLPCLVEAFTGSASLMDEWAIQCDGMPLGAVLAILHWERIGKDPVRKPSRFITVRDAWLAKPLGWRRESVRDAAAAYGITPPEQGQEASA